MAKLANRIGSNLRKRGPAARAALIRLWTRVKGFWRRNYVWLVTLTAFVLAALAALTWLWRLPFLAGDLASLLAEELGTARAADDDFADLRNIAYALAAILGATAIVAAIPFQLIKTWVNERLATATEEGLITDRIAKAVEQLGAEKTAKLRVRTIRYKITAGDRTDEVEVEQIEGEALQIPSDAADDDIDRPKWQSIERQVPSIEVRLGGIYALERISQDSARDHIQIMEILCAYIRHNAPASAAKDGMPDLPKDGIPTDEWVKGLRAWVEKLERPREDVQAALTVIGRRSEERIALELERTPPYRLDLRATNLQRADLMGARLNHAQLTRAQVQGATLIGTQMQGADLQRAKMQRANLSGAQMQGAVLRLAQMQRAVLIRAQMQKANLERAEMQRAVLWEAQMQRANLERAEMQGAVLVGAQMKGANLQKASFYRSKDISSANFAASALREVDFTIFTKGAEDLKDRLAQAFGDGSVKVPAEWGWDSYETGRPTHWPLEVLDAIEFKDLWLGWRSRGSSP
ncbi:MAG: pentapeptide repeat-containing protein [Pseudomonadota bacterium]